MAVYTAIDDPEAYFQAVLYTGTGSSHAITLGGDTDMSPDLVWSKSRSNGSSHGLTDTVRGVTKELYAESTSVEGTNANGLTAFGSDGFTVGSDSGWNGSSRTFVAWCWKESAVSGMDIVGYTGNGSNRTISHSLSALPKVIIVKNRTGSNRDWMVYHASKGSTKFMYLNEHNALADLDTYWQDTDPTTSVFSIGTNDNVNENTETVIAYAFAEKQGFSKFGIYTGNGNADGPFIYTGFRPAWFMTKRTDSTGGWYIVDTKTQAHNPTQKYFDAAVADAEDSYAWFDILSNGIKIRNTSTGASADGGTYVYMAFAEAPFVNSNGVPCNAR